MNMTAQRVLTFTPKRDNHRMPQDVTPIILFCDFGLPYTGQMKGRLVADLGSHARSHPIIDLFTDVPAYDVQPGSVLLAAHADDFPLGSVFVCVVDPGVGSAERKPGCVFAGGRWFVGPLNGLFEHVLRRWPESDTKVFEITLQPDHLSATFHGRDLFSPMAAILSCNREGDVDDLVPLDSASIRQPEFDDDVAHVIYVDGFGNLVTGIRWQSLKDDQSIEIQGRVLPRANTFSDVESGTLFIYQNAVGLSEISANRANAQKILGIRPGTPVKIIKL